MGWVQGCICRGGDGGHVLVTEFRGYFVLMCYGHSISSPSLTSPTNITLSGRQTWTSSKLVKSEPRDDVVRRDSVVLLIWDWNLQYPHITYTDQHITHRIMAVTFMLSNAETKTCFSLYCVDSWIIDRSSADADKPARRDNRVSRVALHLLQCNYSELETPR